jgi:hypothetical protein
MFACVDDENVIVAPVNTLMSIGVSPALLTKSIYGILSGVLEIALLGTINIFLPIEKFFS